MSILTTFSFLKLAETSISTSCMSLHGPHLQAHLLRTLQAVLKSCWLRHTKQRGVCKS